MVRLGGHRVKEPYTQAQAGSTECIHWALKSACNLERENCWWERGGAEVGWDGNRFYQNTLHAFMNSQAIMQDSSMAKRSQGAEQRPVSHDTQVRLGGDGSKSLDSVEL